ncbi:MAG TPA: hypothetical protein VGP68_01655 [Gemmataceae bacterium]|jgi:hypothetical protein|nr:hypothetical protein [Gemmataceae bacterium]
MSNARWILWTALVWLAGSAALRADEPCDRSGYHGKIAWYALPTNTISYTGYYVGGGEAVGGSCRRSEDGTWGWDYRGLLPSRVALWWNNRDRYQGGGGTYKVDGHPLPDVPLQFDPAFNGRRLEK